MVLPGARSRLRVAGSEDKAILRSVSTASDKGVSPNFDRAIFSGKR
jgi:hypothetical protein